MDRKLWAFCCLFLLCSCGGSDGDSTATEDTSNNGDTNNGDTTTGDVQGLNLPSNMSFVSAQGEGSGTSSNRFQINAYNDSGTDYSNDPVDTYVFDSSMEALGTVNMILCLLEQTAATDMVNQGAYIALVNEDKCEQGQNQSSSGETGQASGGQTTEFNSWTIQSARASNTDPQIVKIWVPGEQPDPNDPEAAMDAQDILVEVTVDEGISAGKPYGDFIMNFKGVVDSGVFGGPAGTEVETMRGSLRTVDNSNNLPQFEFINLGGDSLQSNGADFGFEEAVNVQLNDTSGDTGRAVTRKSDSFNAAGTGVTTESRHYAVAFNAKNLARGKDTNGDDTLDVQQCLSRENFNSHVWRYNLYHRDNGTFNSNSVTEGQRVELNSGFPFTYDSDNNSENDAYGWVGYWGIWAEGGTLADGTSISRFDYNSDSLTQYTVNVSPGKMIRRTASTELLSSFQGDEFQYWGEHPTLNIFGQWIVTVDSNNDFAITDSFQWGNNGPETSTTVDHDNNPNTAEVAVAAVFTLNDGEWFWLWSDALGGNINYAHDTTVAANDRTVTFYGEEFVTPADSMFGSGAVTLYCYVECLKGGLTQNDIDTATDRNDLYYQYSGTPFQYTLSAANGKVILTDVSNNQVVSTTALNLDSVGHQWGINTGEMVTATINNPNEPWSVFQEAVTYRWETGANDWNQLITVSDAGNQVQSFDPPLRFTYTHSTANDANNSSAYDGKKFMLEYNGPGSLHGFPWIEDSDSRRWHAAVTLADGAQLSDGTNHFVVKAMEKEQSMQLSPGQCGALDISGLLSDPNMELPTAADIGAVSFGLSDKPNVSDAPAVIEGELQNSSTD